MSAGSNGSSNIVSRGGITLDEAYKVLNVKPNAEWESVADRYKKLFETNDPKKGGSFYLQSKIHRARERIEQEMRKSGKMKEGPKEGAAKEGAAEPVKEDPKA